MMLSCDGHQATLRMCARIALTRGQVGDQVIYIYINCFRFLNLVFIQFPYCNDTSMCGWLGGCMKKSGQSGLKVEVESSCWIPHLRYVCKTVTERLLSCSH